jgi:hypothetical protein
VTKNDEYVNEVKQEVLDHPVSLEDIVKPDGVKTFFKSWNTDVEVKVIDGRINAVPISGVIPNEIREIAVKKVTNSYYDVDDWNDVNIGDIRSNSITLSPTQWSWVFWE